MADDEIVAANTRNELIILARAINEALEVVESWNSIPDSVSRQSRNGLFVIGSSNF